MSNTIFKFVFVLAALLNCSVNFAQHKKFKVTVKWPSGLVTDKMQLFINNGNKTESIDPDIVKNEITVSDNFVSKYATISIVISKNNYHLPAYSQFFVSEQPATIIFNSGLDSSKDSSALYTVINALDVNQIAKRFASEMAEVEKEREMYLESNGIDSVYFSIHRKSILKKLEFIKQHHDSYYAFKLFKSEIVPVQFPNQDALMDTFLDFYKATFPEDLRKSREGQEVEKLLESKWIASHDAIKAPKFTTTDILGNKVSLEKLKGKYILINFWATWCGPCMAELPAIKKISDKYSKGDLSIISVSFDKDFELFSTAVKKNKMDWINVYRDEELASNYGGTAALPKLFLIDRTGTIIYNRSSGKETDFINLRVLNDLLQKELGK